MKLSVVNAYRAAIINDIDQCLHLADTLKTQTLCVKDVSNQTHIRLTDFGRPDPTVKWCRRCNRKLAAIERAEALVALVKDGIGTHAAAREVGLSEKNAWRTLKEMGVRV